MTQTNRSLGWTWAKLSGHENERLIADNFSLGDLKRCLNALNIPLKDANFLRCTTDGDSLTRVDGVLGHQTPAKTDLVVNFINREPINISIKKSASGQVFLISLDSFIKGFELQYNKKVPEKVVRALELFIGTAEDTPNIIEEYSTDPNHKKYELRKHRVTATTLRNYDPELAHQLLIWFRQNIKEIFDFCFSRGMAKYERDWASIIWYKDNVDSNGFDEIYSINEIKNHLNSDINFGDKSGGTTIQLPFGFLQWHSPSKTIPGKMQFHHKLEKIRSLK